MQKALRRPPTRLILLGLVTAALVAAIALAPTISGAKKKKGPSVAKLQKQVKNLSSQLGGLNGRVSALERKPAPDVPKAAWAQVATDGTIVSQSGGITVSKGPAGQYTVNFGTNVGNRGISVSRWGGELTSVSANFELQGNGQEVLVQTWSNFNTPPQAVDGRFEIVAAP